MRTRLIYSFLVLACMQTSQGFAEVPELKAPQSVVTSAATIWAASATCFAADQAETVVVYYFREKLGIEWNTYELSELIGVTGTAFGQAFYRSCLYWGRNVSSTYWHHMQDQTAEYLKRKARSYAEVEWPKIEAALIKEYGSVTAANSAFEKESRSYFDRQARYLSSPFFKILKEGSNYVAEKWWKDALEQWSGEVLFANRPQTIPLFEANKYLADLEQTESEMSIFPESYYRYDPIEYSPQSVQNAAKFIMGQIQGSIAKASSEWLSIYVNSLNGKMEYSPEIVEYNKKVAAEKQKKSAN